VEHTPDTSPVLDEQEAVDAQIELLKAMVIATFTKDIGERKRCGEALDALEWSHSIVILAAAKEVAMTRHKADIDDMGVEAWIAKISHELVRHHADWMRLQQGQIAAMMRSALGNRQLVFGVPRPTRGRLDVTVLQYVIESSMELRDVFAHELDDVFVDAMVLRSRRAFADDFEGQ
jgi:hypothetical protein